MNKNFIDNFWDMYFEIIKVIDDIDIELKQIVYFLDIKLLLLKG